MTLTEELLFARSLSVVLADSPTVAVLVMVSPAVPEFTIATISRIAVELALMSPMVHAPVELA
jgi:hypothetical protein